MTDIIKLHDGELEVLHDCVLELFNNPDTADRYVNSIRELRDRAKALVASATHWTDMDGKDAEIDVTVESFNALQEVLP